LGPDGAWHNIIILFLVILKTRKHDRGTKREIESQRERERGKQRQLASRPNMQSVRGKIIIMNRRCHAQNVQSQKNERKRRPTCKNNYNIYKYT
jgi:hypothetical protein